MQVLPCQSVRQLLGDWNGKENYVQRSPFPISWGLKCQCQCQCQCNAKTNANSMQCQWEIELYADVAFSDVHCNCNGQEKLLLPVLAIDSNVSAKIFGHRKRVYKSL